jgi:hypothetical protein
VVVVVAGGFDRWSVVVVLVVVSYRIPLHQSLHPVTILVGAGGG